MNPVDIPEKVYIFEQNLNKECYSYGWGRGIRTASNLYSDNLEIQEELDKHKMKIDVYKKEINRLQSVITEGIDEFSLNMISDSMSKVSSAEIFGDQKFSGNQGSYK